MGAATIRSGKREDGPIEESDLRAGFKVVELKARNGTVIPVPAQFFGDSAEARVDGDGGCSVNTNYNYLVTVLNSKKASSFVGPVKVAEKFGEELKSGFKDELVHMGLRALRQGKVVQYLVRGLKVMGHPLVSAAQMMLESEDIGKVPEGWIQVRLRDRSIAVIHWIGN